ncbi:hypothetical protein E1B28_010332 [Marasmius oreades]|uniref:Sld7 C-terminal domain-containing protein n=1 Tax=Marasmius oreades TaxID=181124 RepID=A0A9P7RWT1_9AGAR|nr:uncharacterized protein E1B28_010332 [Marasmius oreades]KAG7091284.1 hypothetical protein E1B28_010332 [Marasmius oreades]
MSSPSKGFHRLLYRGALLLPDSHLLLDGITFSARLDAEHKLLDNPLALALESMRGIQTLRFLGTASLHDVYMDTSGDILMDIHPQATLSRIYFENMFCLPTTSSDTLGVRVSLGDSNGPETTQIIIYVRHIFSDDNCPIAELAVARITPGPPVRLPRPDDPTPRKPPTLPISRPREVRRLPNANIPTTRKQSVLPPSLAANLGGDVRLGKVQSEFKVPQLPAKVNKAKITKLKDKGKGKAFEIADVDDVFAVGLAASTNKGAKRKKGEDGENAVENETPLERENKNLIKKVTVHRLSVLSITKAHPEWKELFNYVYRGVGFALRSDIKLHLVEEQTIDRLVATHIGMYVDVRAGDK